MAIALFILGHAGSGKSRLAKRWVKSRMKRGECWAMLDKDICGEALANAFMVHLGLDPNDRDSQAYKDNVRDLEYQACLDVAADQLKLGVSVVLPGPWNKEIVNGKVFDVRKLGFPEETMLKHVYLDATIERMKDRILERENPRDVWKLENWSIFEKTLKVPLPIKERAVPKISLSKGDELEMGDLRRLLGIP